MVIQFWKLKSASVLAVVIWDSTCSFNSCQYFWLYSITQCRFWIWICFSFPYLPYFFLLSFAFTYSLSFSLMLSASLFPSLSLLFSPSFSSLSFLLSLPLSPSLLPSHSLSVPRFLKMKWIGCMSVTTSRLSLWVIINVHVHVYNVWPRFAVM